MLFVITRWYFPGSLYVGYQILDIVNIMLFWFNPLENHWCIYFSHHSTWLGSHGIFCPAMCGWWFNLSLFNFFGRVACGILGSRPGMEPVLPAVEARSLNHWTTREFPQIFHFSKCLLCWFECLVYIQVPGWGWDLQGSVHRIRKSTFPAFSPPEFPQALSAPRDS